MGIVCKPEDLRPLVSKPLGEAIGIIVRLMSVPETASPPTRWGPLVVSRAIRALN